MSKNIKWARKRQRIHETIAQCQHELHNKLRFKKRMLLILFTSPIIEEVIFLNLNQITIKNFIYQSRYFPVFTDLWFVT